MSHIWQAGYFYRNEILSKVFILDVIVGFSGIRNSTSMVKNRHLGFVSSPREKGFALSVFETGSFLLHLSGPSRDHWKHWKLSCFNLFGSEAVPGQTETICQEMSCKA